MKVLISIILILLVQGCDKSEISDFDYITNAKQYMGSEDYNSAIIQLKNAISKNPQNTEARLLLGEIYLKRGQGEAAKIEFDKAISLGANNIATINQYAKSLVLIEDYSSAIEYIDKTYGSGTLDPRIMLTKADAYLGLGKVPEAKTLFDKAKQQKSVEKEALVGIAKTLILNKKDQEALEILESILNDDPAFIEALYYKGLILFRKADYAGANVIYEQLLVKLNGQLITKQYIESSVGYIRSGFKLNKDAEVKQVVDSLMEKKISHPDILFFSALLSYKEKDFDRARTLLQKINKDYINHYASLFLLGAIHFAEGSYEQANKLLTVVVNEIPSHIQARKILGLTRVNLRQLNELDELFFPVLNAENDNFELFASVAQAATNIGDFNLSITYLKKAQEIDPNSNEIKLQLARAYIEGGQYNEGLGQLVQLEKAGYKDDVKLIKAIALIRKGDIESADKIVSTALIEREDSKYLNLSAYIDLFKGRRIQAEQKLERAFELDNEDVSIGLRLAGLKIEEGQFSGAEKILDQLVLSHSKDPDVYMKYAELYLKKRKESDALEWVMKAKDADKNAIFPRKVLASFYLKNGDPDQALRLTSELYDSNPQNIEALLLHAQIQQYAGLQAESMKSFKLLEEMNPEQSEIYIEIARAYAISQNRSAAQASLTEAKERAGNNVTLLKEIAKIYAALGERSEVASITRRVASNNTTNGLSDVELGDMYLSTAEFALAEKHFKTAFATMKSKVILNKLLMSMLPQKKFEEIKKLAEEWYASNPDAIEVANVLVYTYKVEGDLSKAIKILESVANRSPDEIAVLNNLAWLYFENGDTAPALSTAEKAWKLAPNKPAVLDTYAWVLFKAKGDLGKSSELFSKAVSISPRDYDISYRYAVVLNEKGDKDKAVSILKSITDQEGIFQSRKQAEELLVSLQGAQ